MGIFGNNNSGIEGIDDYLIGLGTVRSGADLSPNNDLTVDLNAGNLYCLNELTEQVDISTISASAGASWDVYSSNGTVLVAGETQVDFSQLDDGVGNISTLPANNDATFYSFYINKAGNLVALHGQVLYATINVARQSYFSESKVIPAALDGYVFIGGLLGRSDATNLQAANVYDVFASKLGEIVIGGGASTDDSLQYTGVLSLTGNVTLGSILDNLDETHGAYNRFSSSDGNDYTVTLPNEDQSRIITNSGASGNILINDDSATLLATILPGETYNAYQRGANTGAYSIGSSTDLLENLDHDTRYRVYATANNTGGQGAGDSPFLIESKSVDTGNRFVVDNGDGTYTISTEDYPLKVAANFTTSGTGNTTRTYYIQEVGQPNGTRVADAIDGVFGQGSTQTPASVVVPANTTITVSVRSVSSANNQMLDNDSYLDFTQIINEPIIITNAASNFRLSRHEAVTNLTATIVTGHDLTQATGMTMRILVRDQANDRSWQVVELDVDAVLNIESASTNDGFGLVFDNDFITVNIIDAVTGEITFTQIGRDFEYVWSELWLTADTNTGIENVANVGTVVTTGTFQDLGDSNLLYRGADGDRIHLEYNDTQATRDSFVFLDGIARAERKGGTANSIELQVTTGGQLQIRNLENASTIENAWYEWKDGIVRTTKSIISSDCSLNIDDTGVNQDISVDAVGINEFINNIDPYYLVLAHEGAGGNTKTIQVNGVGATYQNLSNATDVGGGVISFNAGVNGNFNRRGSTVENITKVGEYFDVTTAATGAFDTQFIEISTDPTTLANEFDNNYRIRLAAAGVTIFDKGNNTVYTDGVENGTYRIKRTYFGFQILRNGIEVYSSPEVVNDYFGNLLTASDPITEFAATTKDTVELLENRSYILLEDDDTTVESTERTFDSLVTPYVEIEVLKDDAATHGPMLRANSTGGRQSQLRFNLTDDNFTVANSGANTALPEVLKVTVSETTIKYLVRFNDPVSHTELEISPAAHDATLTPSVTQTGVTGVFGVKLFENNPLPENSINDQSVSGYIDIGNTRMQWGRSTTINGGVNVTLPMPYSSADYSISLTAGNGADVNMNYASDTVNNFQARASNSAGTVNVSTSFSWKTIGLKP